MATNLRPVPSPLSSCGQDNQTAGHIQQDSDDTDTLPEDGFRPYAMRPSQGNVTGLCLVFNNIHFHDPNHNDRTGSVEDYRRIKRVFSKFGFVVEEKRDSRASTMMDHLRRTATGYSRDYCAFVCFFLSHGKEEQIFDCDSRLVPLSVLVSMFVDYCPQMADKPKLFFAQICRDSDNNSEAASSPRGEDVLQNTAGIPTFPGAKDVMLSFATTAGCVAYSLSRGSPFIEKLTLVLEERGHRDTLYEVLRVTRQMVETEVALYNKDMCPSFTSTLTRPLIFSRLPPQLLHPPMQAEDEESGVVSLEDLGLELRSSHL